MDEVIEQVAPVEQPEITPEPEVAPVAEVPEQVYTYQPTDEHGRKLGAPQVFKYKTPEELTEKLTKSNIELQRALREQTKKSRLGITDKEEIPESALKFNEPLEFTPRNLSPDERVKLSRDLLDPEHFEDATNTLFEATVGATPKSLRETLGRLSQNDERFLAKVESEAFRDANPDYYPCRDNWEAITGWMLKNNLSPVRDNFQLAYDRMKSLGVIVSGQTVEPTIVPEPVAQVEIVPPIVEEVVPDTIIPEPVVPAKTTVAHPPTGLTRNQTGESVAPPKVQQYTLKQINMMPADVYKSNMKNPKFVKLVNDLEREAAEKAARKIQQQHGQI